jgi:hypothetical protein
MFKFNSFSMLSNSIFISFLLNVDILYFWKATIIPNGIIINSSFSSVLADPLTNSSLSKASIKSPIVKAFALDEADTFPLSE